MNQTAPSIYNPTNFKCLYNRVGKSFIVTNVPYSNLIPNVSTINSKNPDEPKSEYHCWLKKLPEDNIPPKIQRIINISLENPYHDIIIKYNYIYAYYTSIVIGLTTSSLAKFYGKGAEFIAISEMIKSVQSKNELLLVKNVLEITSEHKLLDDDIIEIYKRMSIEPIQTKYTLEQLDQLRKTTDYIESSSTTKFNIADLESEEEKDDQDETNSDQTNSDETNSDQEDENDRFKFLKTLNGIDDSEEISDDIDTQTDSVTPPKLRRKSSNISTDEVFALLEKLQWRDKDEYIMKPETLLNKINANKIISMYPIMKDLASDLNTALQNTKLLPPNITEDELNNFLFHVIAKGKDMYYNTIADPEFCLYMLEQHQPLYTWMKKIYLTESI